MTIRIILAMTLFTLAGCSTMPCDKPERYLDARAAKPLVLPEGLAETSGQRRVVVPEAPATVPEDLRGDRVVGPDGTVRCLIEPPPLTDARRRGRG